MQIGIRLHDTVEGTLEERLAFVAKQGFTCTHLALKKVIHDESVNNSALTPGNAMHLKRLFAKNNLDVAVLGCYLNLAHPHPDKLKEIQETYLANIRYAAHLGAGVVGSETGAPNAQYKACSECRSELALQVFINNLKPIVKYAEQMGVIMAIEPVLKHIVYDAKRARRVLDEINSPNLQIIFDPVNLLGIENYHQADAVILEAITLLAKDIAVVHIKDYRVGEADLEAVGAGFGEMNYEPILRFIKQEKPHIHVTLENTTPQTAKESLQHIQAIYDRL